ncbi:MAG TPA: hypothetical protein VGL09_15275 [Methylomirabilota bacterium]
MAPARTRRIWWWLVLSSAFFVMSVAAVALRVAQYPEYVPRPIVDVLEPFLEPGLTIWWLTIGKAFQAFPSDGVGRAVAVLGNTAFWVFVGAIVAAIGRTGVRLARRRRP